MTIEQIEKPRDYVAAMLRRDLGLEPTPEELDRLTASLLAAGAFAPERGVAELKRAREVAEPAGPCGEQKPRRRT